MVVGKTVTGRGRCCQGLKQMMRTVVRSYVTTGDRWWQHKVLSGADADAVNCCQKLVTTDNTSWQHEVLSDDDPMKCCQELVGRNADR